MRVYQWEYYARQGWLPKMLLLWLFLTVTLWGLVIATAQAEGDTPLVSHDKLQPLISSDSPAYRTPRAGEGFRTELFGREITVQPSDRRSVTAVDFGVQANLPGADNRGIIPFGALYLWRHPDDQSLDRKSTRLN